MELSNLPLSVRAINCLQNADIFTTEELEELSEYDVIRIKNLGRRTLNEIKEYVILCNLGDKNTEEYLERKYELNEREKKSIEMREQKIIYREIVAVFGVSIERARQIHRKALRKISYHNHFKELLLEEK